MNILKWIFGRKTTAPDIIEDAIEEVEDLESMDTLSLRLLDDDLSVTVDEARAKRKRIAAILRAREVI